jgi:glycosyltransferase involved in cell wall biosynthesis
MDAGDISEIVTRGKLLSMTKASRLESITSYPKHHFAPGVTICIAAYNEEETIAQAVYEAEETLEKGKIPGDIIVIDDHSIDHTWQILQQVQRDLPHVQLRRHDVNQGIAGTFSELYQWANRELVFLNSADGQWKMSLLLDMLPLMDRYDLMIGRRKVKHYSFGRRVVSWLFNNLPVLLFATNTYDAGSIKLARRELYEIPIMSSGVFAEAERIIRASRRGYRVGCVDVEHFPRRLGTASGARLSLIMRSLVDMAKCWIDIVVLKRT